MVGDRLDTDILFGNQGGLSTVLVETGVNREADCTGIQPTYLMDSVDLINLAS